MSRDLVIYEFGQGCANDCGNEHEGLGQTGTELAKMAEAGIPVPIGFTISAAAYQRWQAHGDLESAFGKELDAALIALENRCERKLGDLNKPLIVCLRADSGVTRPSQAHSVTNLGWPAPLVASEGDSTSELRHVHDSYRRFLQAFGELVCRVPARELSKPVERHLEESGLDGEDELEIETLRRLNRELEATISDQGELPLPTHPRTQLKASIEAIYTQWSQQPNADRTGRLEPTDTVNTALTIQAMVLGNKTKASGAGILYTHDVVTGSRKLFGEWLPNAQGEDILTTMRSPEPLNEASGAMDGDRTLELELPNAYSELVRISTRLEALYRQALEIEFVVDEGTLWILQARASKRSPTAEVRIAVDMVDAGLLEPADAIRRIEPDCLEYLLHPQIDPNSACQVITRGLGASPGAATGRAVFCTEEVMEYSTRREKVILVRNETMPEDIHGIIRAEGLLTARGGMTSHAAVVARGLSKPCIVGCSSLAIDPARGRLRLNAQTTIQRGDLITINGNDGSVMLGEVPTVQPTPSPEVARLMRWVDEHRRLEVRANVDGARECRDALNFGAEGVGLCRTEHMFFQPERIRIVREMILAPDTQSRQRALDKLLPMQRADFDALFEAAQERPVTIRLLDPPLHEFLPKNEDQLKVIAEELQVPLERIQLRKQALIEANPMLGMRGCRLGLRYPEIYEIQVKAIVEAIDACAKRGITAHPELMVPLVSHVSEFRHVRKLIETTVRAVCQAQGTAEPTLLVGCMIEVPRACLVANELAAEADFFSFGTNDLTQSMFGLSRDDAGGFLPDYIKRGVFPADPFFTLDPIVGREVERAATAGREANSALTLGICGEQGGEPNTIAFCHRIGLDYVSCSPYRLPIARLAAARAALEEQA